MFPLPQLEKECFFIAPIGPDNSEERDRSDGVLEFIVARAANELGLEAIRGDQLAEPGQITLQVIEHVLGAKVAVADLTGRNPNVYYELAIRHTAKLPTVLICERGETLPFDIAPMRTIFFSHTDLRDADRCRAEIVRQLRKALDGAVDSPVTASVDLQRLQAGNTVERTVAELVTGVSQLERVVSDVWKRLQRTDSATSRIQIYEDIMIQQMSLLREVEQQLTALEVLAHERNDSELEAETQRTREFFRALALSYPANTSWGWSTYREVPTEGTAVSLAIRPAQSFTPTDDVGPAMQELETGPLHRFQDWPNEQVPKRAAGVYTVWDGDRLLYVGMSGRAMTAEDLEVSDGGRVAKGLWTRLNAHASGRRSGDQFCVYIGDRFVVPELTATQQQQLAGGALSLDSLIRAFVRERLAYRFVVTADGAEAGKLERAVRRGALSVGPPYLNPLEPPWS